MFTGHKKFGYDDCLDIKGTIVTENGLLKNNLTFDEINSLLFLLLIL